MTIVKNKIVFGTILPFFVTAVVFVSALFIVIVPMVRKNQIEKEKAAVKDIVATAWQSLDFYNSLAESGTITEEQARNFSRDHIRGLRFGSDMKNYFWIIDMKGKVLVNPYSPNLEGLNQNMLRDTDGKYFIQEFIESAREGEGDFVRYKWKLKDSSGDVEDKISYVMRYRNWDWVVGAGVYLEEVYHSVSIMSTAMVLVTFLVLIIISAMSFHVVKNYMQSEKARFKIASDAKRTETKIRAMIEAIPDMLVRIDKLGGILDIKEPLGFEPFMNPAEMLGSNVSEWPHGAAGKCLEAIHAAFESKSPQTISFDIEKENAESLIFEAVFVRCGRSEVLASIRQLDSRRNG